jgi:acetyltransferase-like isoleucine patch superfamily enzyme
LIAGARDAVGPVRRRAWPSLARSISIGLSVLNGRIRLRRATAVGKRTRVHGAPRIVNDGTLVIGDRVRLESVVSTLEIVVLPGGRMEIGDNVFINFGSSLVAGNHVKIGNDCLIGTHVMVMDCDFHRIEDKAYDTTGVPVVIEDRVWLGNRSMVLKGVTVGHDAVVAAGSILTHDVPPRTVVAGVPARVVRSF